ncbi:MAG: recombinase family protein [Eubacteriales bacterium]
MARKSRKHLQTMEQNPFSRTFRVGIYVRLSVKEKDDKTETIDNQELLIRNFLAEKPEFEVIKVYSDHGKSGVNFNREGYQQLQSDLTTGVIDCIVVKDLSRFARNYLGAGEFLETIFQNTSIRFISINDGYDSFSSSASEQQMIHLTNLAHQLYAQDLSAKIAPVIQKLQREGKFIGAWAAYGYLKDPNDKYKLVIDEEVADIVRLIFDMKLHGKGTTQIVRHLIENNIPSPCSYRYKKGLIKHEKWENIPWSAFTVKDLLQREVYLGHMVQGRKKESLAKGQTQKIRPKSEWIIVKNTHEPIITQEVFDQVQVIMDQRTKNHKQKMGKFNDDSENLFKGIIYCAECGTKLYRYKNARTNKTCEDTIFYTYICRNHTNTLTCSFRSIQEKIVKEAVLTVLKQQSELADDFERIYSHRKFKGEERIRQDTHLSSLHSLVKEKNRLLGLKLGLHESYLEDEINQKEFQTFSVHYSRKLEEIEAEIEDSQERYELYQKSTPKGNEWLKQALKFDPSHGLTKEIVDTFISKIIVTKEKDIEIFLNFRDEYQQLCQHTSEVVE